jgi:hypothetical protein
MERVMLQAVPVIVLCQHFFNLALRIHGHHDVVATGTAQIADLEQLAG